MTAVSFAHSYPPARQTFWAQWQWLQPGDSLHFLPPHTLTAHAEVHYVENENIDFLMPTSLINVSADMIDKYMRWQVPIENIEIANKMKHRTEVTSSYSTYSDA